MNFYKDTLYGDMLVSVKMLRLYCNIMANIVSLVLNKVSYCIWHILSKTILNTLKVNPKLSVCFLMHFTCAVTSNCTIRRLTLSGIYFALNFIS